jgi:hypothetical protein
MSRTASNHDLEAQIDALRRELAAVIVTLSNLGQRLENLVDELQSRRQADKVVALNQRRRNKGRDDPDILVDFLK